MYIFGIWLLGSSVFHSGGTVYLSATGFLGSKFPCVMEAIFTNNPFSRFSRRCAVCASRAQFPQFKLRDQKHRHCYKEQGCVNTNRGGVGPGGLGI